MLKRSAYLSVTVFITIMLTIQGCDDDTTPSSPESKPPPASDIPLSIPASDTFIIAVAAGESYNVGAKQDGGVTSWGSNQYGQSKAPEDLTDVVAVSAGWDQNLNLKKDGTVVAWGYD